MDCLSGILLASGSSLVTCALLAFFVLKCVLLLLLLALPFGIDWQYS